MAKNSTLKLYTNNAGRLQKQQNTKILKNFVAKLYENEDVSGFEIFSETCYYILWTNENGKENEEFIKSNFEKLEWLLNHGIFNSNSLKTESSIKNTDSSYIIEVGPRYLLVILVSHIKNVSQLY